MTSQKHIDELLRNGLRWRAAGADPMRLTRDVLEAIETLPQRPSWRLRLAWPSRSVAVLASASLLGLAIVVGLGAGGDTRPTGRSGPGAIFFTQATWTWDGTVDRFGDPTAFQSDHRILRIAPSGGEPTLVARLDALCPTPPIGCVATSPTLSVSPDGSRLGYRLLGEDAGVYIMDRDGHTERIFDRPEPGWDTSWGTDGGGVTWSPDGTRIAFLAPIAGRVPFGSSPSGSIFVLDVAGGRITEVVTISGEGGPLGPIAWSPDGTQLAYARSKGQLRDSVHGLFVADIDGSHERRLATIDHADLFGYAWAPDGRRLAFSRSDKVTEITGTSYTTEGHDSGLYVIEADGTGLTRINRGEWLAPTEVIDVHGVALAWSPDGQLIATYGPDEAITIVAADGTRQWSLPQTSRRNGLAVFGWSPDGTQLFFISDGAPLNTDPPSWDPPAIYLINADGSDRHWLADGETADWSR